MNSVPKTPTGSFPLLLRLLDNYFSSHDPLPQKLTCLQTLTKILENIVQQPDELKFRSLKARNQKLKQEVLQCPGADLILLEIGFRKKVKDFEEYYVLEDVSPVYAYEQVKRYRDLMEKAVLHDRNAPANKLLEEKHAREAAIRQIEHDAAVRRDKQKRGKLLSGSTVSMTQDMRNLRLKALQAPIVASPTMLPTPDLRHLTEEDYLDVYEPAEDSFALLDAIQNDRTMLNSFFQCPLVLEIGSGSGIISSFIESQIFTSSLHLTTDINLRACVSTVATFDANKKHTSALDVLRVSLTAGLKVHDVDMLVFNPPYVPTETTEIDTQGSIASSWAGGADGMEVTTQVLDQAAEILSDNGLFYMVTVARNKPVEIIQRAQTLGLEGTAVLDRRAGRERLTILRFHRISVDRLPEAETRRMDGELTSLREDRTRVGVLD